MSSDSNESDKICVLNVNDNPALRYMTTRMLTLGSFVVVEAANGQEALARARGAPWPQAVVLDVHLPDLDGFEVCRRLKGDPTTAGLRVLHTSATWVPDNERALSQAAGADGYLAQPFEPAELVAALRELLLRPVGAATGSGSAT